MTDSKKGSREWVAERLGKLYSKKMNGHVWCFFDESKRAYCIQGEGLPYAHSDFRKALPNGWTLLDYIKPSEAREMVR